MPRKNTILNLDFGAYNGKHRFKDLEELKAWHNEQKSFYEWIGQHTSGNRNIPTLWAHLSQKWNNIDQHIDQAIRHAESEQLDSHLSNLSNNITKIYVGNELLVSTTPKAQFVDDFKNEDPMAAAHALLYYLGLQILPEKKTWEGVFNALLFDKGIKYNIKNEKKELSGLKSKWHDEFKQLHSQFIEQSEKNENIYSKLSDKLADQQHEFDKFVSDSKGILENVEKTYDEKLALQSSVTYWGKKAKTHKTNSKWFGGIFFGVSIVGSISLAKFVYDIFLHIEKPEYWQIAILGILTTIGVWILRLLSRIFLSNMHLGNEANERVTMIKTYLALLREGQGPKPEDRQLILQTLFRPSHTGLIKDEGTAPTIFDIASKVIDKGNK